MALKISHHTEEIVVAHEINVTPFIDVMLVLLVVFMATASLSTTNVPLELPVSTAAPPPSSRDPLVLSVPESLQLSLGDAPVRRPDLGSVLDRATKGDRDTRIFVRADRKVKYGDLMEVMELLRKAGYLKVALVSQTQEPATSP